jgi:hypothetical protein
MSPSEAAGSYLDVLQSVCDRLQAGVGHRLFTVSHIVPQAGTAERIFTTAPDVYPLNGIKQVTDTDWTRQMRQGNAFVANRPQDFGPHFFDLDTIVGLGLGAVVNVPVMRGGIQIGSLNLLDQENAYQGPVLAAVQAVMPDVLHGFALYERHVQQP